MDRQARPATGDSSYTARLSALSGARWKQLLNVQAPYRWNLRRLLGQGRVIDVGCGIGRNLIHLAGGSVGVDHNAHSVQVCRDQGLVAYTTDEFRSQDVGAFDGLLAAHVVEHLPPGAATEVLSGYLPYLRPGARVVLICPQERGFAADPTHTVFWDQAALRQLCDDAGLTVCRQFSFPFPRWAGRVFTYNEFVTVAEL